MPVAERTDVLAPFLPRLVHEWLAEEPERRWRAIDASVAFVDVSGFTRLSERLARLGRLGAEELTTIIGTCFADLLAVAYAEGGGLLKFGGDALLLLFNGPDHAERASRAALGMRSRLAEVGRVDTPGGRVRLRMSVGVHTGTFLLFLVGASHRELVITGPAASETVLMEGTASAGEIVVSPATAALLPPNALGAEKGPGRLLRRAPGAPGTLPIPHLDGDGIDLVNAIPVGLRAHLLDGTGDPEHRVATVAFVHFDGTDEFAVEHGPAALADALDELITDIATAATDHDITFLGTDVDHDGGKVILVAGAPRAAGLDEERMLRALHRIATTPHRLPLRIGVHSGHVFAGEIGPPYRQTYTVMGDSVNLAARLMAAAAPGQVLATAGVIEQARGAFAVEPLPPFMVKGKSRPVQAYVIGDPVDVREAFDTTAIPLVGRDDELERLERAARTARGGHGQVVELRGESGVGKSRLVDELRRQSDDLATAHVTCVPYEATNPYWVLREMLHRLLGIGGSDTPAHVEAVLRDHVQRLAPELEEWMPLLATPLQLDLPDTAATRALEPRFRKERVDEHAVTFLGLLLDAPTLIVLEDAHWIDEASTEVLRRIEKLIAIGPWLVVTTRVNDGGGFEAAPETSEVITLEPLDDGGVRALVMAATADAPLRPHDIDLLVARAGGNPRFAIALTQEAIVAGGAEHLPDSVDAAVSAWIDRLPNRHRRDLRRIAVLGHAFDEQLLPAVLDDDPVDAVGPLTDAGFLHTDGPGRLRFRHALLRDVAYQAINYEQRRDLHRRVGTAIEARPEGSDDRAALLSLHLFHGGRYEGAWTHARAAGDRARDAYANVEAAELYERALAAARRLPERSPEEIAVVAERLGDVRDVLGVFDQARDAYRQARRLRPDDPTFEAELCLKEAWMAERLGKYSVAIRWTQRGRRRIDGIDNDRAARIRAQLTVFLASVRQAQGRHRESIRWCRVAIDLARAVDDRASLAYAFYILDWAYTALGRTDLAVHLTDALALYEELGDLGGQALVANNLGGLAFYEGRWDDSVAFYEQGRAARLRTGDAVEAARGSANIAEILVEQRRFDEAERLLVDARQVLRASGYRGAVAFTSALRGRIAARRGDPDLATSHLDEAQELYTAIGGGFELLEVASIRAEALMLSGEVAAALDLADVTIAEARRAGELGVLGPPLLRTRGAALAETGDLDAAAAALLESLELARDERADYEIARTLTAIAGLVRRQGRTPDPDDERIRTEIFTRLGVPPEA